MTTTEIVTGGGQVIQVKGFDTYRQIAVDVIETLDLADPFGDDACRFRARLVALDRVCALWSACPGGKEPEL